MGLSFQEMFSWLEKGVMKESFTIGGEDDPELLNSTSLLRIPSHLE